MNSLARKKNISGEAMTFILCSLTALMIFIPFLIVDKGFYLFCGDYNSQQISFYHYVNDFFKNGMGQYSWETDLGGSIINSYSFYLLGSPFFWLSSLLPASWSPFLMVPLFALKFGIAGFGAYIYLKRYCRHTNFAVLAACLYACSGNMIYNVFFNHFLDCIALFPFLLWALDRFVLDKKAGWFAFFVAINLINNYFFFAGEIVFLFIYYFAKLLCGEYKITFPKFLQLAAESIMGVGMGCALLIPAMISLKDNPRTVDFANGFGLLLYNKVQQYFAIFQSMFFPPDPPYLPSLFTEGVIKWTSMSAFLPIIGVVGVLAFIKARKKSAVRKILLVCLFMAFVPVLNSSFIMLNSSYYARWYYMPILMMCAATMHALEDEDIDLMSGFKGVAAVTIGFAVFGLVPAKTEDGWKIGVANEPAQFWLSWALALIMLVILYAIIRYSKNKKSFAPNLISAVVGFTVLYAVIFIGIGKFPQWENDSAYRLQCYDTARNNKILPSDEFYRTSSYETQDNLALWLKKPSLQFFNSTVSPSIMEFYPKVGVKRDVSSKPEADKYGLISFLSTRYMLVNPQKEPEFSSKYSGYGWQLYDSDKAFYYYENTNYIPMGFVYDKYTTYENFDAVGDSAKGNILVRAMVLNEEQLAKYEYLFDGAAEKGNISYESFVNDAASRKASAAYYFKESHTGFTAKINLQRDALVMFTVPYDEGFTATVNGERADIEKVNVAMSAVLCKAGENEIVFSYKTPGFNIAIVITAISTAAFIAYLIVLKTKKAGKNK